MRWAFGILVSIGLLSLAQAGQAQQRDEDECLRLNPEIQSPVEMVTCISDLEGSEKALSEAYSALWAMVPADNRKGLADSQREWLRYRKAHCRWEAGAGFPMGNTITSSAFVACVADLNRERAAYLKQDMTRW
jgi:uncharacterized protein YecT (DUF1311 family)